MTYAMNDWDHSHEGWYGYVDRYVTSYHFSFYFIRIYELKYSKYFPRNVLKKDHVHAKTTAKENSFILMM